MCTPSEEEECRFFDASEDIAPMPDAHYGSSRILEDAVEHIIQYDIWVHSPGSIKERRSKFFAWMGVDLDHKTVEEDTRDACSSSEGDADRIGEKSEAAVLRTSGLDDGFCSSRSSVSCWCNCNSDMSEDLALRENNSGARCGVDDVGQHEEGCKKSVMTEASQSNFVSSTPSFEQLIQKVSNFTQKTKKAKKRWLSILRSFACVADKMRADDDDNVYLRNRVQRVKVRQCGKKHKVLSALFKGQNIPAHTGSILAMKFSPDGQFLASGGEDGVVRLWQVVEDERLNDLDMPEIDPSCIYFTVNHLSELKPLCMHKKKLNKLRKTSDSACVLFPPKVFRILEQPLHEFHGHRGDILDLSWSKNNRLLSSSVDKTVRLWRIGFDECVRVFPHSNYVTCVQFNPVDENYFISGSIDGKLRIWEILVCQVVDWTDIRDIVTAACYRPDGKGGIIGSISGSCHFFNMPDHHLQLDAQMFLQDKKKSPCNRITGFQFFPQDFSKVMVSCGDSKVRILDRLNVVGKYKGVHNTASLLSACLTSDGKHIVSACEDSNVNIWNCDGRIEAQGKTSRSCECFSTNASIAIPWSGMKPDNGHLFKVSNDNILDRLAGLCANQEYALGKGCAAATWPEKKLGSLSRLPSMQKSEYKLLKTSWQSSTSCHAWGLVIVTAGWDGRIRSFHNYGLPVPV